MNLWSQNFSQKTNEKLQGFLPWEVGQKFLQFFVRFLGEVLARQFCFEINWPLVTYALWAVLISVNLYYSNWAICQSLLKMHRKLWRALVIKWRLEWGKSHQLKTGKQNWRIFSAFWVLIVAKNRSQRPHSSNYAYYYPHGSNLIYKVKGKGKRSMTLCSSNDLWHNKKAATIIGRAQYIYQDSKLVRLVACFSS